MSSDPIAAPTRLGGDFWKFFVGQTISNLGSSFTQFALPLLVFKITGSALKLGLAGALAMLPYLLFGLVIGAWVDRLDRRKMMIVTDLARAAVVLTIPILDTTGSLSMFWIYSVIFVSSTLTIFFNSGEFAAIPSLVRADDLVTANGRIQASYSTAQIVGPLIAGFAVTFLSVSTFLGFDALSFLVSAATLALIATRFNPEREASETRTTIRSDITEGLRYVMKHPVLRNISLMMAIVNFVSATTYSQLVLFSKERLHASDSNLGVIFSAGSAGVVMLSLLAGPLRRRFRFGPVALGALMASGLLIAGFGMLRSFWVAVPIWALISGLGILFNINTGSLRQAIVPSHLLGRIISIASVLAWSAIPLGSLLGGYLIQVSGNVGAVYSLIGVLTFFVALAFFYGPLGHAERYLDARAQEERSAPAG